MQGRTAQGHKGAGAGLRAVGGRGGVRPRPSHLPLSAGAARLRAGLRRPRDAPPPPRGCPATALLSGSPASAPPGSGLALAPRSSARPCRRPLAPRERPGPGADVARSKASSACRGGIKPGGGVTLPVTSSQGPGLKRATWTARAQCFAPSPLAFPPSRCRAAVAAIWQGPSPRAAQLSPRETSSRPDRWVAPRHTRPRPTPTSLARSSRLAASVSCARAERMRMRSCARGGFCVEVEAVS